MAFDVNEPVDFDKPDLDFQLWQARVRKHMGKVRRSKEILTKELNRYIQGELQGTGLRAAQEPSTTVDAVTIDHPLEGVTEK